MMKNTLSTILIAGAAIAVSPVATADDSNDQSGNAAFCDLVETVGNSDMNARILRDINGIYAGTSQRISRRKRLVIHNVQSVRFDGCNMTIPLRVTLKRKIRRDGHGTVTVKAKMKNIRFFRGGGRACVKDARVDKVRLSRTLRIGEAIYRRVANRFIERNVCFNFRS